MWCLFWIETSRQFHSEELVKIPDDTPAEGEKEILEDWCAGAFWGWGTSDSHIFYGSERLSDLLGPEYAPTPKGLREWLTIMLSSNAHFETWQERPYTAVSVITRFNDRPYQRLGFSKVNWPDKWDAQHGIGLASSKAISKIAKEILSDRLNDVREHFEGVKNAS